MKRVFQIAKRDFLATVSTKAFIIGLLIVPAILAVFIAFGPRLFNPRNFQVRGDVAIIDPTGKVTPELQAVLDPKNLAARRDEEFRQAVAQAPENVRQLAPPASPVLVSELHVIARAANADAQTEKAWLNESQDNSVKHLALVVIHPDALKPATTASSDRVYDLYVPPNLDDRADTEIQQNLHDAVVNARVRAQALDRDALEAIISVPRVRSVTVIKGQEQQTVGGFNILLPMAFGILIFIGVMMGGQALVVSTVEEKSSRVIEVLLSAVSPMELMAGKLLGQLGVSLIALSLYIAIGLTAATKLSLLGLINPVLIVYLAIFFLITYLVFGSLMMAVGSAVNEMREAQSLMMPIMMTIIIPWALWLPISRDPNSVMSTVLSFVPMMNGFTMMLRMASVTPPPLWQVWLSIAVGIASVFGALWFTAKVFRIGLLMYGKPPDFATLIRWARAA
jgi:ABC-2 type transport system permease protein